MNLSKIHVRYAKAFFLYAVEKNILEVVGKDLGLFMKEYKNTVELSLMLESPVISSSVKLKTLREIYDNTFHTDTLAFFELIIKNKREEHIPGIISHFFHLVKEKTGIKEVRLTTAVRITGEIRNRLQEFLKDYYKSGIEFEEVIDEKLIGGFVLKVDDIQYDASVTSRLEKVREKLLKTELFN